MKTMKGWISTVGIKRACFTSQKHPCTCENAAEEEEAKSRGPCVQSLSHVRPPLLPHGLRHARLPDLPRLPELAWRKALLQLQLSFTQVKVLSSLMDTSIQAYPVLQYICFCQAPSDLMSSPPFYLLPLNLFKWTSGLLHKYGSMKEHSLLSCIRWKRKLWESEKQSKQINTVNKALVFLV